jgi:hypothetical protein
MPGAYRQRESRIMRYVLIYGSLSGLVIILFMLAGLNLTDRGSFFSSATFGYLIMLVALSFIFIGMKRYRDVERGGVIKFVPAFGLGVGIALVAAIAYVIVWEIYLASTDYRFMDEYIAALLRDREAAGASGAAMAREAANLEWMRTAYRNPFLRVPMTMVEILPVGLLVALISAALLRNPRVLPAAR